MWMDETNFNLFTRRAHGWSRKGTRAIQDRPSSRGQNLHVIGAISCEGIVLMTMRRGAFRNEACNEWIGRVLTEWTNKGKNVEQLVIVCDNAPCHSRIENALEGSGARLLRLGPYSPALNPIETVWSQLKSAVKRSLRIPPPPAAGFGIGEHRLSHLEDKVQNGLDTLSDQVCVRAAQHAASFYGEVLALADLRAGE